MEKEEERQNLISSEKITSERVIKGKKMRRNTNILANISTIPLFH